MSTEKGSQQNWGQKESHKNIWGKEKYLPGYQSEVPKPPSQGLGSDTGMKQQELGHHISKQDPPTKDTEIQLKQQAEQHQKHMDTPNLTGSNVTVEGERK